MCPLAFLVMVALDGEVSKNGSRHSTLIDRVRPRVRATQARRRAGGGGTQHAAVGLALVLKDDVHSWLCSPMGPVPLIEHCNNTM